MNGGQVTVLEGQHGGGAGMTCHEFLGGTGTSSRVVNGEAGADGEIEEGKYTIGVLCQSNYGHKKDMRIGGIPIGALLLKEASAEAAKTAHTPAEEEKRLPEGGRVGDGSIVIIIMQAAPPLPPISPLPPHQLQSPPANTPPPSQNQLPHAPPPTHTPRATRQHRPRASRRPRHGTQPLGRHLPRRIDREQAPLSSALGRERERVLCVRAVQGPPRRHGPPRRRDEHARGDEERVRGCGVSGGERGGGGGGAE